MKANKNLKITKKVVDPLKTDSDSIKSVKIHKDKSSKRRLSIYDEFEDENLDELDFKSSDDQLEDE
jgi:hypothetical protein